MSRKSYRGRHRRRRPVTRVAPALLLVGGAVASTNDGAVAATHYTPPAKPFVMLPFDAKPVTAPAFATPPKATTPTAHKRTHIPAATVLSPHFLADLTPTATTIPLRALAAYVNAAKTVDAAEPSCKLKWQTLAGIGYIESGHARSGGSDDPKWDGEANPPIYGPPLDGSLPHEATIPNTDPAVDGPGPWERAVGPMQFLPSTWARYAADGNHDGINDPQNIDDATLGAAYYLCAASSELNQPENQVRAIFSYNHSNAYVRDVLEVAAGYLGLDPDSLGIKGLVKAPHAGTHKVHLQQQPLMAVGVTAPSKPLRPHAKPPAPTTPAPTTPAPTTPAPAASPTTATPNQTASPAAAAAS